MELQVTVSEAVECMVAVHGCGKEAAVLGSDWIELGNAFAVFGTVLAQVVQDLDGLAFLFYLCQGFQVPTIRLDAHLPEAPEVGHALAHRQPPPLAAFLSLDDAKDLELARIVDRGLQAQHTPFIIHLEAIALHAVLDSPTFRSFLAVGRNVPLEVAMQLASQETHHIFRRKVQGGILQQIRQESRQAGSVTEHDVGRHLALVEDPVVAAEPTLLNGGQQGVDSPGKGIQDARPAAMGKVLTQGLCGGHIVDAQETVVVALITNSLAIHFLGQPLVAVDVHLHLKRKPTLYAHVQEAKLRIEDVEVEVQALAPSPHYFQFLALAIALHCKRGARFQDREDTNQALTHAISFGNRARQVFFGLATVLGRGRRQVQVRATGLSRNLLRLGFHLLRRCLHIGLELLEQHALPPQEPGKRPLWIQSRQMPLEDEAIKHRQCAKYRVLMYTQKRVHSLSRDIMVGVRSLRASPYRRLSRRSFSLRYTTWTGFFQGRLWLRPKAALWTTRWKLRLNFQARAISSRS